MEFQGSIKGDTGSPPSPHQVPNHILFDLSNTLHCFLKSPCAVFLSEGIPVNTKADGWSRHVSELAFVVDLDLSACGNPCLRMMIAGAELLILGIRSVMLHVFYLGHPFHTADCRRIVL